MKSAISTRQVQHFLWLLLCCSTICTPLFSQVGALRGRSFIAIPSGSGHGLFPLPSPVGDEDVDELQAALTTTRLWHVKDSGPARQVALPFHVALTDHRCRNAILRETRRQQALIQVGFGLVAMTLKHDEPVAESR